MVEIKLEYSVQSGETFALRGLLRNVGCTATPTLSCELERTAGLAHVGRIKLSRLVVSPLPLWVAQGIEAALAKGPVGLPNLRKVLEQARVKLFVGGLECLDFVCWRMYDEWEDEVGMLPSLGRETITPWRLAQRMLVRAGTMTSQSASPGMPPVLDANNVAYCRSSDLPEFLRDAFVRQHCLRPQPDIAGVPDAFFASDVARFLTLLNHNGQGGVSGHIPV